MFLHTRPPNPCFCPDITAWTATWHSPKTSPEMQHPWWEQSQEAVAASALLDGSHCWWGPRRWILVSCPLDTSCLSQHTCMSWKAHIKIKHGVGVRTWNARVPAISWAPPLTQRFLVHQPVVLFSPPCPVIKLDCVSEAHFGLKQPLFCTGRVPGSCWSWSDITLSPTLRWAQLLCQPRAQEQEHCPGVLSALQAQYQEKDLLPLKSSYLWAYSAEVSLLFLRKSWFFHPLSKPPVFPGGDIHPHPSLWHGEGRKEVTVALRKASVYIIWCGHSQHTEWDQREHENHMYLPSCYQHHHNGLWMQTGLFFEMSINFN